MVNGKLSYKSIFCALFIAVLSISNMSTSYAADPKVGPGCDPKIMDAMQKKAWAESTREIMIAQTTIAKPDSVFSLGCFDHFANAYNATVSFTKGPRYNFQGLVSNYGKGAFPHTHGGGHYSSGNNINLTNCAAMTNLWNAARCDVRDPRPGPLLGTLQDIAGYNRGPFPASCPSPAFSSPSSATDIAPIPLLYGAKVAGESVGATFDDMSLFTGVTAPFSQTAIPAQNGNPAVPPKCAKGILTGIEISGLREMVCPNPGCVSNGDNSSLRCCKSGTTTGDPSCSDPQ